MNYTQQQFSLQYTITSGIIKSGASGEFESDSKETIKYPASVKIILKNIYERFNEDTQFDDEIESDLIFKINATSNVNSGILCKKLKEFFNNGGKFVVNEDFPRYNTSLKCYIVTSSENSDYWISYLDGEMKKTKSSK